MSGAQSENPPNDNVNLTLSVASGNMNMDVQTDMLLVEPRAPFAFKDSMIHCILQFTQLIVAGCVLHLCTCLYICLKTCSLSFSKPYFTALVSAEKKNGES